MQGPPDVDVADLIGWHTLDAVDLIGDLICWHTPDGPATAPPKHRDAGAEEHPAPADHSWPAPGRHARQAPYAYPLHTHRAPR